MGEILAAAKTIERYSEQKPSPKQLPKSIASCFKYGRCPFYAHCKSDQRTTAIKTTHREFKEFVVPSSSDLRPKSFHLYVDCVPTKSDTAYDRTLELSDLLKPILTKIQTEKELSHYRLAGYGQHVGLIANYLSDYLKDSAYDNRTAILSTMKTPEGCDTLQTLTAMAGQVVRGF